MSQLNEQIKTILRRDLKLPASAPIADDMPFFGGDVDLDSLDMLLLVTSIEKEFGIRIPSQDVGKEVFQNVGSLTAYIEKHRPAKDPLESLPHREPFRFVSSVTSAGNGQASGVWKLSGDEAFFAGHFPGNPLVPGVLIAEALAQISGIASGDTSPGKLAHVDVRFDQAVAPPAEILLSAALNRTIGPLQQFDVSASCNGTVVARGSLTLHRG
jgi:3-hydroxyacyl-[acyl-carrier-protein] dehydratase